MISPLSLGDVTPNVGTMFLDNRDRYGDSPAFAERVEGAYRYWSWRALVRDIGTVADFFDRRGLAPGDRCAFLSANSYARLVAEMAVMSSGLVGVPIFPGYPKPLVGELLGFARVKALAVEHLGLLQGLPGGALPPVILVLTRGAGPALRDLPPELGSRLVFLDDLLDEGAGVGPAMEARFRGVAPADLALIMFTSGTSGFPKGVELTHRNLMSQQKALQLLWKPEPHMRFLCYLPWHHSFGGLFERFFALHSGGCLAIDDSWGKNVDQLLQNFGEIRPNVYFSVPKTYQEIVAKVLSSPAAERTFFNGELKFVFTAAAPLSLSTSALFTSKGIPVVEGWGLTETSPCCTLTERSLTRMPGVVGSPIPGVEIRLGEENEILVRGPNVMRGYLDQPEATARVLDAEGWFKTGDIGEITSAGLRILSRKDRMFKLSNGEKFFPSEAEERVKARCKFVKYAYVFGRRSQKPCLMVFPHTELMAADLGREEHAAGRALDECACAYPAAADAFSHCLARCLQAVNDGTAARSEQIQKAIIVQRELTIENNELTPSFKLIPRSVEERYAAYMQAVEEGRLDTLPPDAVAVDLSKSGD